MSNEIPGITSVEDARTAVALDDEKMELERQLNKLETLPEAEESSADVLLPAILEDRARKCRRLVFGATSENASNAFCNPGRHSRS